MKRDTRDTEVRTADERRPLRDRFMVVNARGGVSLWSVLTGVVVAFGAMLIFSAIIGGILAETGVDANEVAEAGPTEAGLGVGIAMIAAMFLAYLWGGYTAGRMGRGAGLFNGLLVPIVAIIIGVIVAAILNAADVDANLNLPFTEGRLATEQSTLYDWGQTIGVGMLIAMFVGGIIGGLAGHGWHRKLERKELDKREAEHEAAVAERDAAVTREREATREHETTRVREAAAAGREHQAEHEREVAAEREARAPERGGAAAERTPATDQPRSVRVSDEERPRK